MSLISPQVFSRHVARDGMPVDETAITQRPTSSANFYINSLDKPSGSGSGNFTINRNQNLFNGYFNRIAVNEIVLDWGLPNIANWWGNQSFSVLLSGARTDDIKIVLPDGAYTCEQALDEIVASLNLAITTAGGPGNVFQVVSAGSTYTLQIDQSVSTSSYVIRSAPFVVGPTSYTPGVLARLLFASNAIDASPSIAFPVSSPKLVGTSYIDIVSENLTYNQKLRDATTNQSSRDVLYRWYFAYDNVPVPTDAYGFPILQGYDPFVARRTPPIVKQIRWAENQPIGQVAFQVFDDRGRIVDTSNFLSGANFQFQISCLLSEE
jgi:hypothetical protein